MTTFTRLIAFLRPYRTAVVWSFLLAFGAIAGPRAVRRADRAALRPPVPPGDPGSPAADRRADRRCGGERVRRARGQGVRPGAEPARPLPALGPARVRPTALRDANPGAL